MYVFRILPEACRVTTRILAVQQDMAALQGGAIMPELCVYVTLRYLADGSH